MRRIVTMAGVGIFLCVLAVGSADLSAGGSATVLVGGSVGGSAGVSAGALAGGSVGGSPGVSGGVLPGGSAGGLPGAAVGLSPGVSAGAETGHAIAFYVSPDGNDGWSGRLNAPNAGKTDGPFATLQKARDAVRAARKAGGTPPGPVTVTLAGGTWFLDKGLTLTAEDSGTAAAPVIYQAQRSGQLLKEVRLVGGREVAGFGPVTDAAVLARLAPAARGKVLQADLTAQGITNFGQLRSRGFGRPGAPAAMELFFQDQPMTLARWPNDGFARIAGFPKESRIGDGHGGGLGKVEGGFFYEGDRPAGWKSVKDVWVHGYWAWDWANSYERIESIDAAGKLLKTAPPYGIYGFRAGQRFYYLNVLEELDSPGEWYLDRTSGRLYFWPPAPLESGKVLVSILEEPFFTLRGASHVILRGMTMECSRGTAVEIAGAEGSIVEDCTIRNVGDSGVTVQGGKDCGVCGCRISNAGDGGIALHGGDRRTLTPCGHFAENNVIHHVARWTKCYVPAIAMSGVGIRASHNLIHDHPHCAILFGGNENVIELNEIHHVCLETGDVGAIYTGRDWTFRGNVVRNNFIHHTGGVGMGSMGVYMDDCVSGTRIVGNVFWKVQRAAFLGGGRDFRVENNVFVDCNPAVQIDGRGMDKSPVWHDMVYEYMKRQLEAMHPRQPPYSTRYPELADLEKYYARTDGVPPENNLVARNICVGGTWFQNGWHADAKSVELKDNLVGGDPHFVDAAAGNFQLRDDSPAFKLGFVRIPMERIGPQKPAGAGK